ncbi:sigma-70 family RNA polymerase sigma factor [Clostridiales Family XIII bacterium ASD5510]|uniref:Sigma-70 family RNA polymerase sigma factor n=1 Tax=Hominibacterium faecale TaxID=2839743 RepID=A0A9J6QNI5_9FIRM|nr:sigma-70 family RNA polymerase sigma factor [Hominibacterium faecale]MCU7378952.1 sigma-70 family RNA polymerase sigma factor [Hominibacterium faecale]
MSIENIEIIFDSFCRKVLRNRLIDYRRNEAYRRAWEVELDDIQVKQILEEEYQNDEYFVNKLYGLEIKDEELYFLLTALSEQDQLIILLSYFLGFSDAEISTKLNVPRRTITYKRHRILGELRKRGEQIE